MMSILKNLIDKRVDERINQIIGNNDVFDFKNISDNKAQKEISDFIISKREEGIIKLSTLDFVLNLKLPAEQIEKILGIFKSQHKIKEVNG